MRTQPECPECEKLAAVSEESNRIGDFLDWLPEKGIHLATWVEDPDFEERLVSVYVNKNALLAEYFNIDLDKVEQERRALLDWLREVQGG